jgi:multiple sugar transport system substrate-binding protein
MQRSPWRLAVLLAVLAILAAACGSSTTTSSPPAGASATPAASAGEGSAAPSEAAAPSETPAPTPLPGNASQAKPGDIVVRWYCCLGTGDAPEQVEVEQKVAEDFNASHPGIHLQFEGYVFAAAADALSVQLGAGNAPDVVGPVGVGGAEFFQHQWLDLQPFIDANGIDMSQYPQSTVDLYRAGGDGQVGIPYGVYPTVLFYQAGLFKEAGLAEPPHTFNSTYKMPDGTTVPWDYDTVQKLALMLTVDENGKDATEEGFDPEKIVQWGYEPQRDDIRQLGASWKAGSFLAADGKTAQMPEAWVASWKRFYQSIWTDHTAVDYAQFNNLDFNPDGYPFFTGKVAMSTNYMWSMYGMGSAGDEWNMGASPSYQGQTTAAFNADTFRILKASKNPEAAFTVLQYLLANEDLLSLYGAMPAIESEQDAFLQSLQADYKQTIDWDVAKAAIAFADIPNFESYVPAYNETFSLIQKYGTKWWSTPGLDLDAEIAALKAEMQATWDKAN